MTPHHTYSPTWYTTFLDTIDPAQTAAEITFLTRHLPQPTYQRLLDICCGSGRHTNLLAQQGYHLTGIDINQQALTHAQTNAPPNTHYHHLDMRHLHTLPGPYDAILCLWQSFGYFDPATNEAILAQISQQLRPHGRFILDIYHRHFFEQHQGTYQYQRNGRPYTDTKHVQNGRLTVHLDYGPTAPPDHFEWQLYTPTEITTLAAPHHLHPLLTCTNFDQTQPPSADLPRMQLIFEKQPPSVGSSR